MGEAQARPVLRASMHFCRFWHFARRNLQKCTYCMHFSRLLARVGRFLQKCMLSRDLPLSAYLRRIDNRRRPRWAHDRLRPARPAQPIRNSIP
jgi:hypothetical protein